MINAVLRQSGCIVLYEGEWADYFATERAHLFVLNWLVLSSLIVRQGLHSLVSSRYLHMLLLELSMTFVVIGATDSVIIKHLIMLT